MSIIMITFFKRMSWVCARVCTCARVRVCACARVRVCACARERVCACARVRVCAWRVCAWRVCACARVRVCACARMRADMFVLECIYLSLFYKTSREHD